MKQAADSCAAVDALLLDYAYGELARAPRRTVEEHLSMCPACRSTLMAVAETRHAMAGLTPEAAPEAGMESLLAYATQAAAHAPPPPSRFWQWLVPAVSVVGVSAGVLLLVARPAQNPASTLAPAATHKRAVPAAEPVPAAPATPSPALALDQPAEPRPALVEEDALRAITGSADQDRKALKKEKQREGVARSGGGGQAASRQLPAAVAAPRAPGDSAGRAVADDVSEGKRDAAASKEEPAAEAWGGAAKAKVGARRQEGAGGFGGAPQQFGATGALGRDEDKAATTAGLWSNADPLAGAQPAKSAAPAPRPVPAAAPQAESLADRPEPAQKAPAKDAAKGPDALMEEAARLAAGGDYVRAEEAYAEFLVRYPTHRRAPEAALYRADVLDRLGRTAQAVAVREELARRWPDSPQAQAARGASGPGSAPAHPARSRAAPMEKKAVDAVESELLSR